MAEAHPPQDGVSRFEAESWRVFVSQVLVRLGVPEADATRAAEALVAASVRGIDTHGLFLFPAYVKRLKLGLINPRPSVKVTADGGSLLQVDGDNGLGQVVASRAMDLCLERAERRGMAAVSVRGSNHLGAADYYAMMALDRGMVGIAASSGTAVMAPWGAAEPYFATNPLAVAVPCGRRPAVVFDMATSTVARSKIILAQTRGERIPESWAISRAGTPTTDPIEALVGAMLPVGGAKGYGLALIIEVLSGILSRGAWGPHIRGLHEDLSGPQGTCFFLAAINVSAIMPLAEFQDRMDAMIDEIKRLKPTQGVKEVLIPGETRHTQAVRRASEGIPVEGRLVRELVAIGESVGVAAPFPL